MNAILHRVRSNRYRRRALGRISVEVGRVQGGRKLRLLGRAELESHRISPLSLQQHVPIQVQPGALGLAGQAAAALQIEDDVGCRVHAQRRRRVPSAHRARLKLDPIGCGGHTAGQQQAQDNQKHRAE